MTDQIVPDFIQVPANAHSFATRKPVYGVGVNDAWYMVCATRVGGARATCPYYLPWTNMLKRCYSLPFQERQPTYLGCSVVPEWLSFMAFRAWMASQDWYGKDLDKDILVPGNKTYGPGTCVFISRATNSLLNTNGAVRGAHPQGVYSHRSGRYVAQCNINGRRVCIGLYNTPEEAFGVYRACKSVVVWEAANLQTDPRVKAALLRYSAGLGGGSTSSAA